ncbi:hypothetical protein GCM10023331_13400 [Algivirga pacifica]|uniref:DUF4834 domain-containing protein n=2 Tax=Algivirga pacifica TaxID=1162670 RepID=A0ABP9D6K0_9BACT
MFFLPILGALFFAGAAAFLFIAYLEKRKAREIAMNKKRLANEIRVAYQDPSKHNVVNIGLYDQKTQSMRDVTTVESDEVEDQFSKELKRKDVVVF